MKVHLAYGQGKLEVELAGVAVDLIEPKHQPGLANEKEAVLAALDAPIGAEPLRDWLKPGGRIAIAFTDITRATPNDRLIPWLLDYLHVHGVPREQILLVNQVGTHRPNTPDELKRMLTAPVVESYRVVNHEPANPQALVQFGTTRSGAPALLNRHFAEADVRIVTGFIEPHLFAGFSGGVKNIVPGLAGLRTVMHNHGFRNLVHPAATYGVTEGNPLWEELREIALRVGRSFLLNVALNNDRQITGVFAGHLVEAHKVGTAFVRESAMQRVAAPYDIVISTNSGYPLDLNLYQGVKGISAAARIVKDGGTIILAAECREGLPAGSAFEKLLRSARNPAELLQLLADSPEPQPDQWQAQIQALVQQRAQVLLYSRMPDDAVRAAHLAPCRDIAGEVRQIASRRNGATRVAVLPQGPLTIPYIAGDGGK
jgi:nickel-dependent lactate racemase